MLFCFSGHPFGRNFFPILDLRYGVLIQIPFISFTVFFLFTNHLQSSIRTLSLACLYILPISISKVNSVNTVSWKKWISSTIFCLKINNKWTVLNVNFAVWHLYPLYTACYIDFIPIYTLLIHILLCGNDANAQRWKLMAIIEE